jgi:hypothetical protein
MSVGSWAAMGSIRGPAMTDNGSQRAVYNGRFFHDRDVREQGVATRLDAQHATPHISPLSTLVVSIGTAWHPGSFDAVIAMLKTAHDDDGIEVGFYEERDRCYQPFDALGSMRNVAYMKALEEGWEYVMMVDNDVKPARDVLTRLLARFVPIVAPRLEYPGGQTHGMWVAETPPNRGLTVIGSIPLSMVLFKTSVFMPWYTGDFWGNAIGDDEEVHFRKLAMVGHRPFVDTDVTLEVLSPPHFPLDEKRLIEHTGKARG